MQRIVILCMLTVLIAGCTSPQPVLGKPGTYWRVEISTEFENNFATEERDTAMWLAEGTPASNMQVNLRLIENLSGQTWPGDAPCPIKIYVETFEFICPADVERSRAWILSPESVNEFGRASFPTDSEGKLTLLIPRPVIVSFNQLGRFLPPEMHSQTRDPEACERAVPNSFPHHRFSIDGSIEMQAEGLHIYGDSKIVILWSTSCHRDQH